ncbi:putative leucine-rich repeat-containing protein DDB_G0290503 [Neodiprion pinetum]|uniref:putative leucine-rich repeat-containing protein DDB_G0290503 n=1 Tax=Neodiprion pinetum TaxID=441929 RepID=UPI001EDD526B|nr:uncharacterized protein LOC124215010 [Neodiprion pinetum]
MPGCAAIGCNNRSEKGYNMKCFPRDPQLRKEWQERVGRANWAPSKNSFLCHAHFEADQWVQTKKGKLRLKRDAIPSIFTETSTRKSPNKRRLQNEQQDIDDWSLSNLKKMRTLDDYNYTLEFLDDDEYELTCDMKRNKTRIIAQGDGTMCKSIALGSEIEQDITAGEENNHDLAYRIVTEKEIPGLKKQNVIIVSDENNREIGKLVNNNENVIIVADENNKEIGHIVVDNTLFIQENLDVGKQSQISTENKQQIQNSYDDIEERLKQICNGEEATDDPKAPKDQRVAGISVRKDIICTNNSTVSKSKGALSDKIMKYTDKEIPRNLQLIFGTESGDENKNTSSNANTQLCVLGEKRETQNTNQGEDCPLKRQAFTSKSVTLNDCNVINVPKGKPSDSTGMRAAMKRKRTREEVMKSIEKTIADLSQRTLSAVKCDQLTRSILRVARARKRAGREDRNIISSSHRKPSDVINGKFELNDGEGSLTNPNFTIRVTGVADDVGEIIAGLEATSGHRTSDKNNDVGSRLSRNLKNISSSKYLLAGQTDTRNSLKNGKNPDGLIDLRSDEEQFGDSDSMESEEGFVVERDYETNNETNVFNTKQVNSSTELSHGQKGEFLHIELDGNERKKKVIHKDGSVKIKVEENINSDYENVQSVQQKYSNKPSDLSKELRQKLNAQQEVIKKLTNQLIIYKELETKLVNLKLELQVKNKQIQIFKEKLSKKPQLPEVNSKNESEMKQQAIYKLSNRVNQLEEANKTLMKQIGAEAQNKKYVQNLKQKDEQIKVLNWKLEKASKFLERAEKNANTYKKKMFSMRTSIKQQKAANEKQNKFKNLFIDNASHEFSETALLTAIDIRNSCGLKCYEKLLSYKFPLPSLRTLRRHIMKENNTDRNWGDNDQELIFNGYEEQGIGNEAVESEVTGTVQDIFEESNDLDDLNSNELGEHILSQLGVERMI